MFAGISLALIGMAAFASWRLSRPDDLPTLDIGKDFPLRNPRDDEAGLCPWRQPEADRKRFFGAADIVRENALAVRENTLTTREDTLVLSRMRPQIAKFLGRQPTAQENAILIHRILRQNAGAEAVVGTIVTRCVAGESGVIELVLAVDANGKVLGARLQRLREPETVARELQSNSFLRELVGKTWQSDWALNSQNVKLSASARPSAAALLDGARTALILLHIGEETLTKH